MPADLNVLRPTRSILVKREKPEDLVKLTQEMYDLSFSGVEQMSAIETELLLVKQWLNLRKLPDDWLRDEDVVDIVGEEGLTVKEMIIKTTRGLGHVRDGLVNFVTWLDKVFRSTMVSEKYIVNKYSILQNKIQTAELSHIYAKNVPTYDVVTKRLSAILTISNFLKHLSEQEKPKVDDSVFTTIVTRSEGLIAISAPYKDGGYNNLVWKAPELKEYEIKSSPWAKASNIQKVRNLTVAAKYSAFEKVGSAAKSLKKKCDKLIDNESATPEYAYDSGYNEQVDTADTYNAVYVISKLTKQLNDIFNKEINTLMITYISRLIKYKTI